MGNSCHKHSNYGVVNNQRAMPVNPNVAFRPQKIVNPNYDPSRQDFEAPSIIPSLHAHPGDFIKKRSVDFRSEYEVIEEIGEGGFGTVVRGINKRTGQERAIKVVRKENVNVTDHGKLMDEVKLLIGLDHPNIVKTYEVFEDPFKYYIVSELLTGGELLDLITKNSHLGERGAARVMRQILGAVAYCHKFGIVHRDLKPENILFDSHTEDTVKIIDFGLAQSFKPRQRLYGIKGTAYYIAPEVLDSFYTEKCDVWSCGVILYVMLSGYPPFPGRDNETIMRNVMKGKYNFNHSVWNTVSPGAKKFIERMLTFDPSKRCSAEEALHDPWFMQFMDQSALSQPIAHETLDRLRSYRTNTRIQEAVWVYLVSYFSTKDDLKHLYKMFKTLDTDRDGQLTKDEIKAGYMKYRGMSDEMADIEAEKIITTLDTDRDGLVNYSDFINAAISRKMLLTKDKLEKVFRMIDKNGDGVITAEELRYIFNDERISKYPKDYFNQMIAQADKNNDGVISFDEFRDMMVSLMNSDGDLSR